MSTNPAIQPYEGDNALWCLLGVHVYDTERCRYCGRKDHTTQATTHKA